MENNNEGTDFKKMSQEELKEWINNKGQEQESVQPEEMNDDNNAQDPSQDKPNATEEPTSEQDEQASTDPSQDKPKDAFEGKTTEDLLQIVREQQKFISRQGSEIGTLKKQVLETIAKGNEEEPKQPEVNYGDYNKSDVEFIRELIHNEFGNISQKQQKQEEDKKKQAFESNAQAYKDLESDPEVFAKMKPILDAKFKKAGQDAVYKEGWMRETINKTMMEIVKGTAGTPKGKPTNLPSADLSKKKQGAATINNSRVNTNSRNQKPVGKMSSAEFLKHIQENMGIKDTRR